MHEDFNERCFMKGFLHFTTFLWFLQMDSNSDHHKMMNVLMHLNHALLRNKEPGDQTYQHGFSTAQSLIGRVQKKGILVVKKVKFTKKFLLTKY